MTFWRVDHFDNGDNVSFRITLSESDNSVRVDCQVCPSDGGLHTQGIENIFGNIAYTVPGRNSANFTLINNSTVFTPVPCNDDCPGAETIAIGGSVSGTTTDANSDTAPVCGTTDGSSGGVWYTFTGNGNIVNADLCNSDFDTKIRIYEGSCAALSCVAGTDDAGCGGTTQSEVEFCTVNGTQYWILVHGFGSFDGNFELNLTDLPDPPSITCPSNVTISQCDATYTYSPPTASDDCGVPIISQTAGLPSGINFPVGTTTNTFVATDGGGQTASCSFTITVTPAVPFSYTVSGPITTGVSFDNATANPVSLGDDSSVSITLPFTFYFFEQAYNNILLSSNGYIRFGSIGDGIDFSPDAIPSIFLPNNIFAGMWDDLNPLAGGTIAYETFGTTPNRRFVVSFNNVRFLSSTATASFEMKLFESTNWIEVHTGEVPGGFFKTQGIENINGTVGYFAPGRNLGNWANPAGSEDRTIFAPVTSNDDCINAIPLGMDVPVSGNTLCSTPDTAPVCGTSDSASGGIWYSFEGTGELVNVSLCGSSLDTRLRVFSGDCNNLICEAGDDNSGCGSLQSEVEFCTTLGTTYYVLVHGSGNAEGAFGLSINNAGSCGSPPVAICQNVTVNADVNCQDITTMAADFDGGSSDADGDPLSFSVDVGAPYPLGVTNVVLTVTADGETDNCSATITVVDNTDPELSYLECGFDNANDPAYAVDGWQTGDNGGSGFGPWTLFPSINDGSAGAFIGSSADNGDGDSNGDSDIGTAFGIYSNPSMVGSATARRPFAQPLTPGSSFDFKWDNGFVIGSSVNLILTNSTNTALWVFRFITGSTFYSYNDLNGNNLTTIPFTDEGLMVSITVLEGNAISATITSIETGASFSTGPSPLINPFMGDMVITGFDFQNINAGFNQPSDFFFTDLEVCYNIPDSCPDNIVVDNDLGACSAVVDFPTILATDNCVNPISVSCTPPSGSTFNVGTTTVTCTATDNAGNSTSCSFDVTVNDTEDPTISCPADITVNNDPGNCSAVVTYSITGIGDNCPGFTVAQTSGLPNGVAFPVGTTTNAFTITDATGNTANCSFNVTVNDIEDPVISCGSIGPSNILVNPSFETGNAFNIPFSGSGWTSFGAVFGIDGNIIPPGQDGNFYLKMFGGNSGTFQDHPVNPGDNLTASVYIENASFDPMLPGCEGFVQLDYFDSGGGLISVVESIRIDNTLPQNTWTQISLNDTAPAGAATVRFIVIMQCSAGGAVMFDDASLINNSLGGSGGDITVDNAPGTCGAVVSYTPPQGVDNCPGATTALSGGLGSGATFPVGTTTETYTVTDAAGNTAQCSFAVTVNDTEDPTINCPADITVNNDPGNCSAVITYSLTNINDNCPGFTVAQTSGLPNGLAHPVGTTTNAFTITDASGNTANCSFNVTVNDTEAPVISCGPSGPSNILVNPSFETGNAFNQPFNGSGWNSFGAVFGIDGNIIPPGQDGNFYLKMFGGNSGTFQDLPVSSGDNLTASVYIENASFDPMLPGCEGFIQLDYFDSGGGLISVVESTRIDNTLPQNTWTQISLNDTAPAGAATVRFIVIMQCSAGGAVMFDDASLINNSLGGVSGDITVDNDPGSCAAVVNYTPPQGTDNCPGATTALTGGLGSGATFPVGTTTETYTVTDAAGNTAQCSFTVTVNDSEPPVATCQDVTVQLDANGNGSTTAQDVDNGSSDNCGVASVSINQTTFGCSDVGSNTVTLTVVDNDNNTSTCTANVTVEDNIAPIAICQDITVQLDASGNATIFDAQLDNGSSDACGLRPFEEIPRNFDCDDVGPNTLVLVVYDLNINQSSCTSTVTVEDNVDPVAVCQNITIQLDNSGNASITADQVELSATDACGIGQSSVSPNAFICSDVGSPVPVVLTVTDVNGNVGSCLANVTVEDVTPPVAVCTDITVQLDASGNGSITAADIGSGSTDVCANFSLSIDVNSFDCNAIGDNTVTLTVDDNNGNTETCTATVTVEDNVAPDAQCQDVNINLSPAGTVTISENDVDNGSSDACGLSDISLDQVNFGCSDVGSNTVILTVKDGNGNSSSCSATVNVFDVTPPVAECDDLTVQLDASGSVTISTADVGSSSSDECGIGNMMLDKTTFDCGNVGQNFVVLTVVDNSGNSDNCSAEIIVEDNVGPNANCQDITVQLDQNGNATITASQVDDGSGDNCAIGSISIDVSSFGCVDIGDNTVVLTVTDSNGNTSTCSATVTVENGNPIVISSTAINETGPGILDGSIDLTISGGAPPYQFNWSNGDTTEDIGGLAGLQSYVVTVTDDNGCSETATIFVDQGEVQTVQLCLTAYLGGMFDPLVFAPAPPMRTTLRDLDLIPLQHPYNVAPWNYNGPEAFPSLPLMPLDMSDWLLMNIRDGVDPSIILYQEAVVLHSDGSISRVNGQLPQVSLDPGALFFVELMHFNHLPISTPIPLQVPVNGGQLCHDFTTSMSQAFDNPLLNDDPMLAMPSVNGMSFGMVPGNVQSLDIQIDANDANLLFFNYLSINVYAPWDPNGDGNVDLNDVNILFFSYGRNGHTPY
ncbi:MAG: HYR domain-containing protein [Bacteroidota bacterium]